MCTSTAVSEVRAVEQRLTLNVHRDDDGTLWADVAELPGCFASGTTLDELVEAAREAVLMYTSDRGDGATIGDVLTIQLLMSA